MKVINKLAQLFKNLWFTFCPSACNIRKKHQAAELKQAWYNYLKDKKD